MFEPLTVLKNKLAYTSLVLVGLMWIIPFQVYSHQLPLTAFYSEWWAAVLGSLALVMYISRDAWQPLDVPRIVLLPLSLVVIVLLQTVLGKEAYFNQTLLFMLYMAFAALLMLLGATLRDRLGMQTVVTILAIFLLAGSELSALTGFNQHYHWHMFLDWITMGYSGPRAAGNVGQPNQLADYSVMGLISLGLLYRRFRLKPIYVVLLALPLLYLVKLTGSRSAVLFLVMMCVLAWWSSRRDEGQRPLLFYSLLLLAGLGLVLMADLWHPAPAATSVAVSEGRSFGDTESASARLYLWRESLWMLWDSPVLGVGLGQFAINHIQLLPVLQPSSIQGYYTNAHNLIFQFASEMGFAGLIALVVFAGWWLYGLKRQWGTIECWWACAILGVLGIHSLLEYPLWYSYFLGIAAFLLGMMDKSGFRLVSRWSGRVSAAIVIVLSSILLARLEVEYGKLQETLQIYPESPDDHVALDRIRDGLLDAQQHLPLLSQYADLTLSGRIEVSPEYIKEKLALNGRVLSFYPVSAVIYRQAMLLAQDNQLARANEMMRAAIWSYPSRFPDARRQLDVLVSRDPGRFRGLLEFAEKTSEEHNSAVRK